MILRGTTTTFLDGNFKKQYPGHVRFSWRDENGKWFITKAGPRYVRVIQIIKFDEAGEKWLIEQEQRAEVPTHE